MRKCLIQYGQSIAKLDTKLACDQAYKKHGAFDQYFVNFIIYSILEASPIYKQTRFVYTQSEYVGLNRHFEIPSRMNFLRTSTMFPLLLVLSYQSRLVR